MKANHKALIEKAYLNFNARNIPGVLATMASDVIWPKGFEGGFITGHDAVSAYWTRQWQEIDPNVKPVVYLESDNGNIIVEVKQHVKDLNGNTVFDGVVHHTYTFENDLISKMEIS